MTCRIFAVLAFAGLTILGQLGSPAWSQDASVKQGLRLAPIVAASEVPPRPGRWWPMPLTLINSSNEIKTGKVTARLTGTTQRRFATTLTVSPGESLRSRLWIRLPESAPGDAVNVSASIVEMVDGREFLLESDDERSIQDLRVPLEPSEVVAARVSSLAPIKALPWEWRKDTRHHSYELIVACRNEDELPTSVIDFDRMPGDIRALDAIDNVFVNSASGLNDPVGVAVFRQWIVEGGRAWIALDLVSPEELEPLLGDVWQAETLGFEEFSDYEIQTTLRPDMAGKPRPVQTYHPVRVRTLTQTGGEVTHLINDWPAAIRLRLGKGEVWLTTVEASAWYRPAVVAPEDTFRPEYLPNDWAIPIVGSFQQPRNTSKLDFISTPEAAVHVGYPVPSRAAVFGSLGFFAIATSIVGVLLWRRGRLELTGWAVPAIALLSATPLFASAQSSRNQVVDTVAHVQFADVQPGSGQAVIEQRSAVYLSQPRPLSVDIPKHTSIVPFVESSTVAPLLWENQPDGRTRINFPNWPTGLQPVHTTFTSAVTNAEAIGRFTETGVEIELPDSIPGAVEDVLFIQPPTRVSVPDPVTGSAGTLSISAALPTLGEIRLGSGMLDQKQRHHQDVFRAMFSQESREAQQDPVELTGEPSLLTWSAPWHSPLDELSGVTVKGEALSRLRVRYLPSDPGSQVMVPANTLKITAVGNKIFDPISQQMANGFAHTPLDVPRIWTMQWQLPRAVLPLKLETAQFAMQINAPGRTVTISSISGDPDDTQTKKLGEFVGVNETVVVDVNPSDLIFDPATGTVAVQFEVSDEVEEESDAEEEIPDPNAPVVLAPEDKSKWQIQRPEWIFGGTVATSN